MPVVKKIVFTFIGMVVIPVVFFAALELGLRLAGVGKSFEYFREIDIAGQTYYQENPDFADQFYPESLNIGPLENTFTKQPGPDLVRVYVLGGSAAQGFPHRNHGFDRLLETQLRAALPSQQVEVINTAMTSVNSHVVYAVARSIPDNSADFAVILMGNNEVVGPYGPGTFNQNFLASIRLIRSVQALKRTRIWQLLDSIIGQLRASDARAELEWEGMQMFTDHGVPHDDPRMQSVYNHYEKNLSDIIEVLQRKGIHVLVSSVPVNLRHSAPFLSSHGRGLTEQQRNRWQELNDRGRKSFEQQDWQYAIDQFGAALEIDPEYADTHFRLATALENTGHFERAKAHYQRAMDLDALRFRADTRINELIREVTGRFEPGAVSYVDSAAVFRKNSEPYLPGWNLLLEHVHYDFLGNHVLAAAVAGPIVTGNDSGHYQPLSVDEVARRVGYPNHETIENIRNLQGMIEHPPFPGQSNYTALENHLSNKLDSVTAAVGSPRDVIRRRQAIVTTGLADWKVHFELAALNRNLRNQAEAYYHLRKIFDLYPHNHESYVNIAEWLSKRGKWHEVIPYLERSLSYTRDDQRKIAETLGWLGTAYFKTGQYDQATKLLLQVPRKYPDQVYLSLKAYGNLVKYAREQGQRQDLDRYARDVQRYARRMIKKGRDIEYPLLYRRLSQILTIGGYPAEAQRWAELQGQQSQAQ